MSFEKKKEFLSKQKPPRINTEDQDISHIDQYSQTVSKHSFYEDSFVTDKKKDFENKNSEGRYYEYLENDSRVHKEVKNDKKSLHSDDETFSINTSFHKHKGESTMFHKVKKIQAAKTVDNEKRKK